MLATPMTAGARCKPPTLDHPIAGMAFSKHVAHYMHEKRATLSNRKRRP